MCAFFCYKYLQLFMEIPHLYEINPFDNSVNPYSSISGHTFENRSSEKPALDLELRNEFKTFFFLPILFSQFFVEKKC